jgi:hypothetical protein
VVSATDPHGRNLGFLDPEPLLFHSSPHEADWTPFQTNYFSENMTAPGIEPGTSGSIAKTTKAVWELQL